MIERRPSVQSRQAVETRDAHAAAGEGPHARCGRAHRTVGRLAQLIIIVSEDRYSLAAQESGRSVVRPPVGMTSDAAWNLVPQPDAAIVLALVAPLKLRTIENVRLLTAADVDLLNVVVWPGPRRLLNNGPLCDPAAREPTVIRPRRRGQAVGWARRRYARLGDRPSGRPMRLAWRRARLSATERSASAAGESGW